MRDGNDPRKLVQWHGSDCPKCGGTIGAYSDMCLDCGYDPEEAKARVYVPIMVLISVVIILLCWLK